jgi:hypothetical protein
MHAEAPSGDLAAEDRCGVVRQEAVEDPGQLAVDTGGSTYSAIPIASCWALTCATRLADLKSRRLHLPAVFEGPDIQKQIAICDLDGAAMEPATTNTCAIASSIRFGQCSAVQALDHYGSAARGESIHTLQRAVHEGVISNEPGQGIVPRRLMRSRDRWQKRFFTFEGGLCARHEHRCAGWLRFMAAATSPLHPP